MNAMERVLKEMKELLDLDEINKNHSTGSVYRAFPHWLEFADQIYQQKVQNIKKGKQREAESIEKAKTIEKTLQSKINEVKELDHEISEFETRTSNLEKEIHSIQELLHNLKLELDQIQKMKKELSDRGLTEENLAPLLTSDN